MLSLSITSILFLVVAAFILGLISPVLVMFILVMRAEVT